METGHFVASDWIEKHVNLPLDDLRIDTQATMGQIRSIDGDFRASAPPAPETSPSGSSSGPFVGSGKALAIAAAETCDC